MTNTFTTSTTFTRTDAEYLASKVVSDLRGMKAYYYRPDESLIWDYYEELAELLSDGYLASVEYGFKRNGQRVVTLFYELRTDGSLADGKSGGVYARADISGTTWFSFLAYSRKWHLLSPNAQQEIEARLPIQRSYGQAPQDGSGYWVTDRSYSSKDVGTQRRTFRPY